MNPTTTFFISTLSAIWLHSVRERDEVGPDIAAELFPGTDPAKLSFAEMVDFLKLKRFGSLVDGEMDQQVFIMDLSFNPEITDELMVIYFDLNQEIVCITHES